MAIHPEAATAFFDDHHEEAVIARLFDEAFDITFGADDDGGLSYWLARPTTNTAERFGFQRELVVIYCHFPETDARVVRLFDQVRGRREFSDRVDPSVGIVVHNGDPAGLARILETAPCIVVPLLAKEVRANQGSGFIRGRIAATLGEVDPFAMSSPIAAERDFFGRTDITQTILSGVRSGQNAGLFGLRKTGKTSVLFALKRRLQAERVVTLHVDCQSPGVHFARWWQLLERIVDGLAKELQAEHQRKAKVSLKYNEENAAIRFRKDVNTLLTDGAIDQVVLLLDEIEHVTPQIAGRRSAHWDEDFLPFWQTIRAVHQELQGKLTFVVAGVNPAAVERPHFATIHNPIFELAVPRYLGPFDTESIRDMVRTVGRYGGVRFDDQAMKHINEDYGGHPYLIRLACSEVWKGKSHAEEALIPIGMADFVAGRTAISNRLASPIRDILLSMALWYPDDYDLLRIIAEEGVSFASEYLAADPTALAQYARVSLLDTRFGRFRVEAIKNFLIAHGEEYKQALSPFSRSEVELDRLPDLVSSKDIVELFEMRTEVEKRLRHTILSFLAVHNGYDHQKVAKDIVGSLTKTSTRPDPSQLFIGRKSEEAIQDLYFDDLRRVVINHWQVFSPLFENKSRFDMNMDTANRARRVDAHAKAVNEAEREEYENSFRWLLTRLRKVPD